MSADIDLLTQAEAAKLLRIGLRQLQRLDELGEGPPKTRLSERRIAYPRAGLIAWVNERTSPPIARSDRG